MLTRIRPRGMTASVALVIGSCTSLQFGAALAVQLFPELGTWGATALRLSIAALVLLPSLWALLGGVASTRPLRGLLNHRGGEARE